MHRFIFQIYNQKNDFYKGQLLSQQYIGVSLCRIIKHQYEIKWLFFGILIPILETLTLKYLLQLSPLSETLF